MVNYSNSKIYKIEATNGTADDIYIGSTTKQYLSQRMTSHRADYNRWKNGNRSKVMSFDLFDRYGIDNCIIVLLETFPCSSKDELLAQEKLYIKNNTCVNRCIPLRTSKEYYQDNKVEKQDYYETNKDHAKQVRLLYVANNQETIKQKRHEYYLKNKILSNNIINV